MAYWVDNSGLIKTPLFIKHSTYYGDFELEIFFSIKKFKFFVNDLYCADGEDYFKIDESKFKIVTDYWEGKMFSKEKNITAKQYKAYYLRNKKIDELLK